MRKVLVSLVSEQTIPNILFIKEMSDAESYIFISTKKMIEDGQIGSILKGANIPEDKVKQIIVEEDDLNDINSKLIDLDIQKDDQFIVNLTGGTKIMSIGAYNFFKKRKSEIFYLPIGKNIYREIYPKIKKNLSYLKYRINLEDYLTAYGIEIKNKHRNQLFGTKDQNLGILEKFFNHKIDMDVIDILREIRDKMKENTKLEITQSNLNKLCKSSFQENQVSKILTFFKELELEPFLTEKSIDYLTGGWFEEYVYSLIKEHSSVGDSDIGNGVKIRRKNIDNELDVIFVHDNALFVIECKTLLEFGNHDLLIDSLYKQAALKKDFGLVVKGFIFTLDDRIRDEKNSIKIKYQKRADILGIEIIDKYILENHEILNQKFFNKIFGK